MLTAIQDLGTVLSGVGQADEGVRLLQEALLGYERTLGDAAVDTLRTLSNLAGALDASGRPDEARPLWLRHARATASKPDASSLELRSSALALYRLGEYQDAEKLIRGLLERNFEVASSLCHLARILILTGRETEASEHVARAWEHRLEAAPYVSLRILWFQFAFSVLESNPDVAILGRIKTTLQADNVSCEWTMDPVLANLEERVTADEHALLSALVAALSSKRNVATLDSFPVWSSAQALPLDMHTC
jgi:tetratricopeptide (TPR) repeat protein